MKIFILIIILLSLSNCVSSRAYVESYQGHPQARDECLNFLERSEHFKVTGQTEGEISTLSVDGEVLSQSDLKKLKNEKGNRYESCLNLWTLKASEKRAENNNECINFFVEPLFGEVESAGDFFVALPLILASYFITTPICYLAWGAY